MADKMTDEPDRIGAPSRSRGTLFQEPSVSPEEDRVQEEGDLGTVQDRKTGSQPGGEAVDEAPGDFERTFESNTEGV